MNFHIDYDTEGDDVMARVFNPELGLNVVIVTAPYATLQEDGPTVTQISDSDIVVMYSDEFVENKLLSAARNADEFGEAMAFSLGVSYLISTAIIEAEKRFHESKS